MSYEISTQSLSLFNYFFSIKKICVKRDSDSCELDNELMIMMMMTYLI